jgi:hypothetical protein
VSEPAPGPERPADERPEDPGRPERVVVTRRRAPRYRAFGLTGGLVGVAAGLVLGLVPEPAGEYTRQAIAGYFATALGLVGALLGLGVALLAERRHR